MLDPRGRKGWGVGGLQTKREQREEMSDGV